MADVIQAIQPLQHSAAPEEIERAFFELSASGRRAPLAMSERVALAWSCLESTVGVAGPWVQAACQAKGIDPDSQAASEDVSTGPMAVARYLQLLVGVLSDVERRGHPQLPGRPFHGPTGRLLVSVFPARGLFDGLLFRGFRAHAWMQPHVTREYLNDHVGVGYRNEQPSSPIALVLGAGNVSAIAATDALSKIFEDGRRVLLKMNPVNSYLGAIFAEAFAPLIDRGLLRIIQGGAQVGAQAIAHPLLDEIHITGSTHSHNAIVWGPPGPEMEARRSAGQPLLQKRITSELGNVTPWIVVPGPYSERQLDFQAENVAAMIVNNASFNCVAAKMIVTWRGWPDRQRFLDKVQAVLDRTPPRFAYYPCALERFERFTGKPPPDADSGFLPWTLVRDVRPDEQPQFFSEESFVCVCAETALDAPSPEGFVEQVGDFVNERLWGTLGAGIMVHPASRRGKGHSRFWRLIEGLRYGTVAINQWPGLSYAVMTAPWGGYPGATLAVPQSGIGWVHNPYQLDGVEKTVLEGPLVVFPKPLWFPSHRRSLELTQRVLRLYHRPKWRRLPALACPALLG